MAGATISLTVQDDRVRRALTGLASQSRDLQEPFEEIGASLLTSTQQRFEDEEDPEGDSWPELAPRTQRRIVNGRPRGGAHILRVSTSAGLYGSLTYLATATDLRLGSNKEYAAIHQLGGTEDMPPGPAAVPARPFLGISRDDEQEIGHILIDHLQAGLN